MGCGTSTNPQQRTQLETIQREIPVQSDPELSLMFQMFDRQLKTV